jgi:hypothetical protein
VGATPILLMSVCVKREWVDKLVEMILAFDGGYGEDSDFGLSLAN